ncbi:MAG: hypothetical protein KBG48_03300 [Kofleriaceae bacterium]|nr:hypothetical protein [Kofleriaceae bacterium]MBP9166380.1 hypothetical protein [Kofleriaceae bacterium]MBP9858621.1 hypothetical protein [Kofleriaceae bacterium]
MNPKPSEWRYLLKELCARAVAIFTQPRAFFYVFVFGALLGGLGTWGALFAQEHGKASGREVLISAATFGVALCFTGIADSVLEKERRGLFRFALLVFGLLSLIPMSYELFQLSMGHSNIEKRGLMNTLCVSGPPWLVWAVANARDVKFEPEEWDAAAGGNPVRDLQDRQ